MDLPKELIDLTIDRGAIILSSIFSNIDHDKFFVIIGVDEENIAGFFFINSNINFKINNKPEQLDLQFEINNRDYSFLDHTSYICATEVMKISKNTLVESLQSGLSKKVGQLTTEDTDNILNKVRESKLFSNITKIKYFYT